MNTCLGELADGGEDLCHGPVLDVVVVDAVQHDVDDVHEEVDEGAAALGDEQLDQVQDLGLAPRQHVVRDVHVEGLRVGRQVVVPRDLLGHRRDHGL